MATKTQYLTYHIHLTDPDLVAQLQAQYPEGVNRAPYDPDDPTGPNGEGGAAVEFAMAAGVYPPRLSLFGVDPLPHTANFLSSPWFVAAGNFPRDAATFQRKSGGFLGIGGTTIRYYWMGQFVLAAPETPTVDGEAVAPAEILPIAQRHFCEGFEVPGYIAGQSSNLAFSPQASRHRGGLGVQANGRNGASTSIPVDRFDTGATPSGRWDRIRVRLNNLGSASFGFWRAEGFPSSSSGAALVVLPSGQLAVENIQLGARSLLGVIGDISDKAWYLLDILYEFNSAGAGGNGRIRVYINHAQACDFSVSVGSGGLGANSTRIASCAVGNVLGVTGNDCEVFLDDWIQSAIPQNLGGTSAALLWASGTAYVTNNIVRVENGNIYRATANHTASSSNEPGTAGGESVWTPQNWNDWSNGSKVALVRPSALGSGNAWGTGTFRGVNQVVKGAQTRQALMSTSSSAALLEVDVDTEPILGDPNAIGPCAMQVCLSSTRGAASGSLGFSVNGAVTDTAIVQSGTGTLYQENSVMYRPSGLTEPPTITPLKLRHTKGAGADLATASMLVGQVELLGVFGAEDQRASETEDGEVPETPIEPAVHNRPYPFSPWAVGGVSAPIAPYIIFAGTYVGTGAAGLDLTFRSPVHLFFTRPTTGADVRGVRWWSSCLYPSLGTNEFAAPAGMIEAKEDQTFVPSGAEDAQQQRYLIQLDGTDVQNNALGTTYQYLAISDPGMRWMLNTALVHDAAQPSITHPLINPDYLPEFALFLKQPAAGTNSNTARMGAKSSGHATQTCALAGVATANALQFNTGSLTTLPALHAGLGGGQLNTAFMLWRAHDGNDPEGEDAVVSFGAYTGDGAASRTLTVGTAGKRPLYALIIGDGSNTIFRDPSHTSTNSSSDQGTNSTTGITGGAVNSISVGTSLNGNGVNYSYIVWWAADATAGNGGWGTNPAGGEIVPVEPDSPADGPWPDDPDEPTDEEEPAPTPNPGDLGTDIAAACLSSSTQICNLALQELGITQQITSLATDTSKEGQVLRLAYKTVVDQVLRAFPWPFAKAYADLVLVGGEDDDPVNADWQYSYRVPSDYLAARRIVNQEDGRKRGPYPAIPFQVGADDTGDLIFTDAEINDTVTPNVPPVLEYTKRVGCPASRGDAIFRQALIFRLAAAIAKSLGREAKDRDEMMTYYRGWLVEAKVVHANEQEHQDDQGPDADWIAGR
jgi:hypothetical protein